MSVTPRSWQSFPLSTVQQQGISPSTSASLGRAVKTLQHSESGEGGGISL